MPAAFSGWFSVRHTNTDTHTQAHVHNFCHFCFAFILSPAAYYFRQSAASLTCFHLSACACVCVCVRGILIIQTSSMCSDSDVSGSVDSESDASSSFLPFSLPTRRCFMCSSSSSFLALLLLLLLLLAAALPFVVLFIIVALEVFHFIHSFIHSGVVSFIAKNPQVQTSRLLLLLSFCCCFSIVIVCGLWSVSNDIWLGGLRTTLKCVGGE